MLKRILFSLLFLTLLTTILKAQNALKNNGFEQETTGWNNWGANTTTVRHSGTVAIEISNTKAKWSGIDQVIVLPNGAFTLSCSGWIKTKEVVAGNQSWEVARIGVEFYSITNELVGGYPAVVGQAEGTMDWTYYSNEYSIPEGASKVKFQLALANCSGTAYFDDLSLILFSAQRKPLVPGTLTGPMDKGKWYPLTTYPTYTGSHFVDWSSLLDAPAGKHGFLTTSNDQLQFKDGTPAKFWGTNLVAATCFPSTPAIADSLALRLSKMGCNLVRLHHMDAPWSTPNIFGNKSGTTQLDPKSLDKVDYLIYALKKKGIYVFLDLLVHRDFTLTDGVQHRPPDLGGKQVAYYDSLLIVLQQQYIQQWMEHINPYTQLAYKREPAIIASEFINESTVAIHFGGDLASSGYYRTSLEKMYEKLGNPPGTLASFQLNWDHHLSPTLQCVRPNSNVPASLRFYKQTEDTYYQKMYAYSRNIGIQYLLTGSNYPMPILYNQENNSRLDFCITNDYWDHPQVWKINNEWEKLEYAPINNTSILRQYNKSFIANLTKYTWKGKPFMVTEYNACYPNEYVLEGIPVIAAYAQLQGMDGLMQFAFDNRALGSGMHRSFDLSTAPDHLAQWVVAAPLFLKSYVQTAPNVAIDNIRPEDWRSLPNYSTYIDDQIYLPYVTKVAKSTSLPETPIGTYASYQDVNIGSILSETKELILNYKKGTFQIQTPFVQGAVGEIADQIYTFSHIKIETNNEWASVLLCSADGLPLSQSKRMYVVITTPVKMTGQTYDEDRLKLVDRGQLPYLVRYLEGTISFPSWRKITLTPLEVNGSKAAPIELLTTDKNPIRWDVSNSPYLVYELNVME